MQSSTFSLKIMHDDSPMNPWTEWDCEPPLMYRYERDTTHYGTESTAKTLLDSLSDATYSRRFDAIIRKYDLTEVDYIDAKERYGYTKKEWIIEQLTDDLDDLDLAEYTCELTDTPCLRFDSRGYSQGDYADVLIILTPEWFTKTGANPKHATTILESTRQLFDAWSWGDVYGFKLIEHKPLYHADGTLSDTTDDDIIDSCYGFYGDDFDTNGLRDSIPPEHRHLIDDARNNIS